MLLLFKHLNMVRYTIILFYFIIFLDISFSLESTESISMYYGMEVRSDLYIKPHPDFNPPSPDSISYVNKNDPYPNLPKIPFNVAATVVVTGLIIQTYCFYYTEPVGWWPLWPF